jgi:DnaJ family protein A protein 2
MGPIQQQAIAPCNTCNSKGKIIPDVHKCTPCTATGYILKEKTIAIPLKNGFGNGLKMQLEGKGNQVSGTKSDLIVIINELEHPVYKRRGSDLIIEVELKLFQALFGFDKVITHLDGRKLHLHHTGKTNYGTIRKINEEGMEDLRTKRKGDLIIKFNIDLPTITNETLTKALILINKDESVNEKEVQSDETLVKTIMLDTVERDATNDRHTNDDEQEGGGGGGPECAQQ